MIKAPRRFYLVVALGVFCFLLGCSADDPQVEGVPDDFVHELAPTDEMMQAARLQCDEDETLEQGVVELAEAGSGDVVSRAVVDC